MIMGGRSTTYINLPFIFSMCQKSVPGSQAESKNVSSIFISTPGGGNRRATLPAAAIPCSTGKLRSRTAWKKDGQNVKENVLMTHDMFYFKWMSDMWLSRLLLSFFLFFFIFFWCFAYATSLNATVLGELGCRLGHLDSLDMTQQPSTRQVVLDGERSTSRDSLSSFPFSSNMLVF